MKEKTCCFTGHRSIPDSAVKALRVKLKAAVKEKIKQGYIYFMTGGAMGFDTLAAETVLNLREQYPHIRLVLALPCRDQTRYWKDENIERYEAIKEKADHILYISHAYNNRCMHKRNRYMVDNSAVCIAYLTKKEGGTRYTVNYAEKKNCEVIRLKIDEENASPPK